MPGRRRVLSTNVRSRSSTPSQPLFFARALYSCPSSRRRFSSTKPPYLQPFDATTDASLAAPLPGTPPAQPSSVTFSGRRLNLSSFSGHPAWAWIFVSKLSFIYPRTLWNAEVTSCFQPCGRAFPHAPCMKDGKCSKGFPKPYQLHTLMTTKGYPRTLDPLMAAHTKLVGSLLTTGGSCLITHICS